MELAQPEPSYVPEKRLESKFRPLHGISFRLSKIIDLRLKEGRINTDKYGLNGTVQVDESFLKKNPNFVNSESF